MMLDPTWTALWLLLCAAIFAIPGLIYARRRQGGLDDYISARNSQNTRATVLTLVATTLGTWILFGPAQAATWGGIGAVLGYALGSMVPRLVMIPLGRRMRELIPEGHGLTEFVIHRYGRTMYAFTLTIMLFYLFISLAAGLTAIAHMVTLLAPIPLWLTACVVMIATLLYTFYGGLRTTIFTDKVQMLVILPLLALLLVFGWQAAGGVAPTLEGLQERAPQLLDVTDAGGLRAGLTFFIAVMLTGLFYQGTWQRIYAARDSKVLRRGFWIAGLFNFPVIVLMGLFGLAFVGLGLEGDGSVALFSVLLSEVPLWFALALIPLGLALVMSSADTTVNATSSIIAVDMHRLLPQASEATLMRLARWLIVAAAVPVTWVAAQGYSVLYLFLLADLLCSAAAFPVFFGLFNRRYDGRNAVLSTAAGLVAGLAMFPSPSGGTATLLESFLLAAFVPVLVSLVLMKLLPSRQDYDFTHMGSLVRRFQS
ncbi:sodium:solute symporter family protein [Halomonas sp.]|uniref:sodium:solute symporter family protein n=1 Tax=Halomonas sp. TaxID=1486246 RepID=UPI000C8E4B71|nr:sodium:solute symporter family protein [Halomonas sp.]MAR71748.1 sodium:solute symporter [Halomonas sp.]|tara:strand:+ start:528 stop:1973 length:1446 start_codon:yes stop_codon:yes gene_type:complete